ncbi:MAG: D-glycero-beta-D-manno-heptose 1-phosphate adenylyltransferase [Phycisphaerales bacterium]
MQAKDLIGKRRTLDEARIEIEAARREGKKIVFTNGCFDIIHAGHISLLRKAREHGDLLVVGLNSDDSVRRLKGPERPVHDEDDRVTVLSELESVAVVVVFEEDTPLKLIETLRPDVLVKGADYTKDQVVGGDIVESYGGEIALVELLAGRSTTGAIERIRSV